MFRLEEIQPEIIPFNPVDYQAGNPEFKQQSPELVQLVRSNILNINSKNFTDYDKMILQNAKSFYSSGGKIGQAGTSIEEMAKSVELMSPAGKKELRRIQERLDVRGFASGQPKFKQQSPELVGKAQNLLTTTKTELPKLVDMGIEAINTGFGLPVKGVYAGAEKLGILPQGFTKTVVPRGITEQAQKFTELTTGSKQLGMAAGFAAGFVMPGGKKKAAEKVPEAFKGFKDLTTRFLEYAKGKTTFSRQEISDFAKRPELKKGEADNLNKLLQGETRTKIPAQEFADSIKADLLPLKSVKVKDPQFRTTSADYQQSITTGRRGKNYEEVVFESPIRTGGSSHYPNSKNYFAHARGDEVVEGGKKIWREQEIQSDLLQKEGMEQARFQSSWDTKLTDQQYFQSLQQTPESHTFSTIEQHEAKNTIDDLRMDLDSADTKLEKDIIRLRIKYVKEQGKLYFPQTVKEEAAEKLAFERLSPFTNDRFGERIMRERIKEKAQQGYVKYRLPTGETIGKIEGFQATRWYDTAKPTPNSITNAPEGFLKNADELKIGMEVQRGQQGDDWIITDILEDGRFKAIPKNVNDNLYKFTDKADRADQINRVTETFDLTGKSNPQSIRYEKWGKFLKNKFGGKEVIDPQGNSWWEVNINENVAREPVLAYGHVGVKTVIGVGVAAGATAILAPLIQGKLHERTYYNTFKEAIDQMKPTDFKYIHDNLNLISDEKKRSELNSLLVDKYASLMKKSQTNINP